MLFICVSRLTNGKAELLLSHRTTMVTKACIEIASLVYNIAFLELNILVFIRDMKVRKLKKTSLCAFRRPECVCVW